MRLYVVVALLLFCAATGRAQGQVPIPNAVPCVGTALNGAKVPVRQIAGPSPAWAFTSWPNGFPVTVYSSVYFQMPPLLQYFTSLHECGHAQTINPDEYAANCFALQQGNFTPQQIALIGQFFQSLTFPVGQQYGGSGAAFWAGTMARCPQFFPGPPPAPSMNNNSPP
jgi:hypothetical protein